MTRPFPTTRNVPIRKDFDAHGAQSSLHLDIRISRWVEALDSRSSCGLLARVMAPERHSCGAVSGALPAAVWPMHIASPLLLIPRTEPPLIQAQRGSLGRGSGAARWPGSGGPTSRFPWICVSRCSEDCTNARVCCIPVWGPEILTQSVSSGHRPRPARHPSTPLGILTCAHHGTAMGSWRAR